MDFWEEKRLNAPIFAELRSAKFYPSHLIRMDRVLAVKHNRVFDDEKDIIDSFTITFDTGHTTTIHGVEGQSFYYKFLNYTRGDEG